MADLSSASSLFVGLLGGSIEAQGSRTDHEWAEITWGGPLGLRLVAPSTGSSTTPLRRWLGGRTGRVHHLEFDVDEPASVSGAEPATAGLVGLDIEGGSGRLWVVRGEANAGLRLVLTAS